MAMNHKTVEDYIVSLPGVTLEYPFGEGTAVYKANNPAKASEGVKMFALIAEGKEPLSLSLKCDPQLAEILREKYVTVMPGYHLNKRHWNTLVLSGEIPWEEVQGFIWHSYQLVSGAK
jgi:predicted DNA-binding protein (MmcQ/YjbR family)